MPKTRRASRKLVILRCLSIVILVIFAAIILTFRNVESDDESNARIYTRAKQACTSEIWIVQKDAVFYDISRMGKPFPEAFYGERIVDFACNERIAEQKLQTAKKFGVVAYFVVLSFVFCLPLPPVVIIWWLAEELRHHRSTQKE